MIWRLCINAIAINGVIWKLYANAIAINDMIWRLYANAMIINGIKKSPLVQFVEPKGMID